MMPFLKGLIRSDKCLSSGNKRIPVSFISGTNYLISSYVPLLYARFLASSLYFSLWELQRMIRRSTQLYIQEKKSSVVNIEFKRIYKLLIQQTRNVHLHPNMPAITVPPSVFRRAEESPDLLHNVCRHSLKILVSNTIVNPSILTKIWSVFHL